MATRVMPHFGHLPAWSSMTSSSPAIVHTYEIGGNSMSPAGAFGFAACARAVSAAGATATAHAAANATANPQSLIPNPFTSLLPMLYPPRMLRSALVCVLAALAVHAAKPETFDDTYRRLQKGREYTAQPTGLVRMSHRSADGVEYHFALNVPDGYDPAKKYQVRIQLHGGVGGRRDNQPVGTGLVGALAGAEQIYVIPYAWYASPWWSDDQVDSLHAIVEAVKRRYNVDENRVVVSGVSDGGTGAYYVAMRDTTPYASFLPLNGYWMVLASRDIDNGEIFANNLRNKPLFIVNGGRDPLYPTRAVDPYVEHYKKGGVSLEYHPQPDAGHNTQWWPVMKEPFETFVRTHPRLPLPDALTWETGDASAHNRAHWLVIDHLGSVKDEAKELADLNEMAAEPALDFGVRSIGTRINRVMPGSNAEQIGVKSGDVLVRLNDQTVRGAPTCRRRWTT
jgi:poly(3-hydroxybutyrate) depolymerase